jgi:hypothetical protein
VYSEQWVAGRCLGCGEGGEGPDWWIQSSGLQADVENVGLRVRGLIG